MEKRFRFGIKPFIFFSCAIVILLSNLAIAHNFFINDNWTIQPSPTNNNLFSVSFTDNLNGWAVGASGTIIHTSNGGLNWFLQNDGLDYPFVSVSFPTNNKGWIVANKFIYSHPVIISTTNSGLNWNYFYYPDTNLIFRTVYFNDTLNGYIGTYNGLVLKTTNGGVNWITIQNDSSFISFLEIKKFDFYNHNKGVAVGGGMDIAGVFRYTTNAGYNWSVKNVAAEPLNDVRMIDSSYIIGSGGDFEFGSYVLVTTNFGTTFDLKYIPVFGLAYTLYPRTKDEWWISMGFTRTFQITFDRGNTFYEIPAPQNSVIYDMVFIDSLTGWCVGTNGTVAKYNNSVINVKEDILNIGDFELFQNYPNPFNSSTVIKWNMIKKSNIKISVFDLTGREISTLVNSTFNKGLHYITYDASELKSGVYFYSISSGSQKITKSMVVVK